MVTVKVQFIKEELMDQELYLDLLKRVIAAEKRIENLEQALEHRAGRPS